MFFDSLINREISEKIPFCLKKFKNIRRGMMSNPIPKSTSDTYVKSFIGGACAAAGRLVVEKGAKHVEKYGKPGDPCGCDALCAKVTLAAIQLKHSVITPLWGETTDEKKSREDLTAALNRRI